MSGWAVFFTVVGVSWMVGKLFCVIDLIERG